MSRFKQRTTVNDPNMPQLVSTLELIFEVQRCYALLEKAEAMAEHIVDGDWPLDMPVDVLNNAGEFLRELER